MIQLGPGHYFGEMIGARAIGALSVTVTRYRAGQTLPMHSHGQPYIFVPLTGGLLEQALGREHECSRGSFVFNEAGEPHRDRVTDHGASGLNIEIPTDWLDEQAGPRPSPLAYAHAGPALWAVGVLQLAASLADGLQTLRAEECVVELINTIQPPARPARADAKLWRVEQALREGGSPPRLRDLAAGAGVHPSHLCRAFRRRFGCSISRYAAGVRADRALRDLISGAESLALVARRHGYADQAHMTRALRAFYGDPPGRLRARLRDACSDD